MADRKLKYWGWGYEDAGLDADQTKALLATFADGFGIRPSRDGRFPTLDAIELPKCRLEAPASL
ncbi:MAG: hypothetical protein ABJ215_09985, partial [Alphaproteobacteria bacterium]